MTQDVLKYLQPNAAIPIDMETTSLLVNALKKALSEHAMQEVQRLGQEIEQEPVPECPNLKGESMNKDEALTLEALKFAASKGYGRIVHEMKITPFTIKYEEALAQPEQEPVCPDCKAVVLYECVACSSNNYPPQRKPLTDKAITQVINSMPKKMKGFMVDWDLYEFAQAIEAKLKETT